MNGLSRGLKKFSALSENEKRLFIEALFTLAKVRIRIVFRPFKAIVSDMKTLRPTAENTRCESCEFRDDTVDSIARAIRRASRVTPWRSACLEQAFCAEAMLRKREMGGKIVLGVNKRDSNMKAHAWSICRGRYVTGEEGSENFTPVSVFEWINENVSRREK